MQAYQSRVQSIHPEVKPAQVAEFCSSMFVRELLCVSNYRYDNFHCLYHAIAYGISRLDPSCREANSDFSLYLLKYYEIRKFLSCLYFKCNYLSIHFIRSPFYEKKKLFENLAIRCMKMKFNAAFFSDVIIRK